ncbi:IMPACT family protein [Mycoplasma mycoides]|uniref:IMPACT family protein n=1 Tax=Mycoplasma mycoides TaxID=2102 RepID=UPI0022409B45|nr:YigZ family protein [Mycoplasma mycoides]QVK02882.1 YigZ family protein [Mycoplasma mycoides subsp. capri]QVK03700.1 YigZ family protein [Mycoplasma mycoides subsp. capri]
MKTIKKEIYKNEFIIKNSKFITIATNINSKDELEEFLNKYSDINATHNCYAYMIYDQKLIGGYNDDHEPKNTAGKPIFNVISKNNLVNIVILVIRYFGGIKLGANVLSRTYSHAASLIIKDLEIIEIKTYYQYLISFDIRNLKLVNQWINQNNIEIISKDFSLNVVFKIRSTSKITSCNFFKIIDFKTIKN